MKEFLLSSLQELWGRPVNRRNIELNQPLGPISTDTRNFVNGSFFIPLVGNHFNGHAFLLNAFELGAQGALVSQDCQYPIPDELLHWVVKDTLSAYQQLGLFHRLNLSIPVVAITGSVGKTTTREIINSALSSLGDVLTTSFNNNNDVGVPLTLLQANSKHHAIVLEMGMRGPGEIRRLSCCSKPDVAVITNIGTAHIGRLGSREAIASAKCEIVQGLDPSGLVVIPAGDPLLERTLEGVWNGRISRVLVKEKHSSDNQSCSHDSGFSELPSPDLVGYVNSRISNIQIEDQIYNLPLDGLHNAKNLMLAFAVAKEFQVSIKALRSLSVKLPGSRNKRIYVEENLILDETYNSSPEAVFAALDLLVSCPGRHFAVLGTMMELGEESLALHRQVAERVLLLGIDGLIIVSNGAEAEVMRSTAESLPLLAVVETPEDAADPLKTWLRPQDTVLLKASRGIGLERLIPLL